MEVDNAQIIGSLDDGLVDQLAFHLFFSFLLICALASVSVPFMYCIEPKENMTSGGRRCIGRPRKRWLEDIEEDIREMGIRTWRRRAQDRGEWATIVRQALVLQGS
ncbi:hypothetical protein C0J52_07412 [Blattella germanica]|nr:hypothetical protein C0J52_07412 [Blattella germanica]